MSVYEAIYIFLGGLLFLGIVLIGISIILNRKEYDISGLFSYLGKSFCVISVFVFLMTLWV